MEVHSLKKGFVIKRLLHSSTLAATLMASTVLLLLFPGNGFAEADPPVPGAMIEPVYETIDMAIARGDLDDVQRHILAWPDRIDKGSHPKLTPLHQAILRKQEAIALLLIDAGADVNRADGNQRTPLHLAVERDLPEVAKALLDKGAEPDKWDNIGWAPLHHAAAKDRLEIARILLEGGASPMRLTERGGTPLHEAAVSGSKAMVEMLLAGGVDPAVVASDGGTALEVARSFGNEAAITILENLN